MSDPKPTRVGVTLGSTSRNGGEFEFRKISLSLDRDLGALENPIDAYRDIKALLERMVSEFQAGKPPSTSAAKPKESPTVSEYRGVNSENQAVSPRPAVSKLATLQERLGPRLQDVEVVEGFDGLSVKPKKYLGESWAEINEVIRALGGHWTKGQTPKDGAWRIPK